jgi:NAD(P)-dependent dehydrogenase (short-subunit alcohol dehydrogenase family)
VRSGAGLVAYTASKAAVAALAVALSEEVAKDDILVNAVTPSIMDTPANRAAMPKADHKAWPMVEEVAATILFLASPANNVTRGATCPSTGGRAFRLRAIGMVTVNLAIFSSPGKALGE